MVKNNENLKDEVVTKLSLNENDGNIVSDIQKEFLKEEIEELPSIKEGDINISGVYAFDMGENVEVKIYIRNGFNQDLELGSMPFTLVDNKGKVIMTQYFDLSDMGKIPPLAARPYKLYFNKENVKDKVVLEKGWEVIFDKDVDIEMYANIKYEGLPENLSSADKEALNKFLEELPKLKAGEVKISTFNVTLNTNGDIVITILIRNGIDDVVEVPQVPVTIVSPDNKVIASSIFKLENVEINPMRAIIYNLVFATDMRPEKDMDLNEYKVIYKVQ